MLQVINMNSTEMKCFENYVLVKPEMPDTEEVSDSGIVIGTKKTLVDARPCTGTIVTSGSDKVKPGDYVVFPQTDGLDCKYKDGEFLLLKAESIIGLRE